MATSLFALLWSEAGISYQSTDPCYLEEGAFLPILVPTSWYRLLQERVQSCLPQGWEWGPGISNCTKSWFWPKLAIIYCPTLPLEIANLQQTPEFQNHQMYLPLQLSRWRDRFLVLPTPSSSNPLCLVHFYYSSLLIDILHLVRHNSHDFL